MGRDGLKVGVQMRKFVIIPTKICCRSVCNHPFLVGAFLFLLFLYRTSPFLLSLLVSASPVLVCTAVLLGTLLSFGEPNIPSIEEEDRISAEIVQLKTGRVENTTGVENDESFGSDSRYTELRREVVERSIGEEPLLSATAQINEFEADDNAVLSSLPIDHNKSRELVFGKQIIGEASTAFESSEIEQKVNVDDQKTSMGAENVEDFKSAEGSVDGQINDEVESSLGSWKQLDEVLEDRFSPVHKVQAAVHARIRDQLESSLRSWKQWDEGVEDKLSPALRVQTENFEDLKSVEGSTDAKIRDQLESSLGSWKQLHADQGGDGESESGSDGAESSSPDASLADILPMLDELHPLLEDENPQTSNLSRQSSAATMGRSGKSHDSSIHSDDESDQMEEEEAGDIKSDAEDDDEDETQGSKDDPAKSVITWTEDDQKNLMDLGTSELERNQRLESLIARRRARRNLHMVTERNLIDLDGMDLQFPMAPISTSRHNPFDFPHDSYDELGLPPIPGSAPSVLLPRRNPFDLPYDSSEEKPDLTGDSFQEEFLEITQREASNQREAMFRRNETFSIGSSNFDFGRHERRDGFRASRFRPYFMPERTDSDVMSYSSLQRQFSELSESKASSVAETESISAYGDEEEKPIEHESAQEMEPISEIEHASLLAEHGSQSSENVHSLSDEENDNKDFVIHVPEIDSGREGHSPSAASHTSGTGLSVKITPVDRENYPEAESWMYDREVSTADNELMQDSINEDGTDSSSSSFPKEYKDVKADDVDEGSVNREQSQVNSVQNADVSVRYSLETSMSDFETEHSLEPSDLSHAMQLDDNQPKEPVYDLSPQAFKKNHSSSSISSYLKMETSQIDLHHLSSERNDLLVSKVTEVLDEDTEQKSLDREQGTYDNSLSVKQTGEGDRHSISESQLSEINQHPITDSSYTGLMKAKLLDDNVCPHEGGQLLTQEEDAGVSLEGELDTVISEDDMPSAIVYNSSEKRELFADHFSPVQSTSCLEVELREQTEIEKEADQQLLASSSLNNHDNNVDDKQISALAESHYFPRDPATDEPCSDQEQESSVIHRKLEEVDQVNIVDASVNVVSVQEPQDDILSDSLQSNKPSSQADKAEEKPVAELADKEHVHNNISKGYGVAGADEKILYDFNSDIKEMDEELLSELDAVGDFRVKDLPNLHASLIYSNADAESSIPEQVLGEVHSSTLMPISHNMSEGNTYADNFELVREFTESDITECEESNVDSHVVGVSNDLLALEAQSMEDINAAVQKVNKGEVQNVDAAKFFQAEHTREQVEAPYPENELLLEDTELGTHANEVVFVEDNAAFSDQESVTASKEGQNLELKRREIDSGMLALDAVKTTQDDEDFEKIVETETEKLNTLEALATSAETGVGSLEFAPVPIDRDIEKINNLLAVEASAAPAVESGAQKRVSFVESEPLQVDTDIKEREMSPFVEAGFAPAVASGAQIESVSCLESVPLQINRDTDEIQESQVIQASLASAVEFKDQTEGLGSVESESLLISRDIEEVEESPVVTARSAPSVESGDQTGVDIVESASVHTDIKEEQELLDVKASSLCSVESGDQTERSGFVESESLLIDRDIKQMEELHVVESSMAPSVDSEHQTERAGSVEPESSLTNRENNEILESLSVDSSIAPAVEYDGQIERVGSVELESSLIDRTVKEIQELPIAESSFAPAVESDSLESNLLQIDADIKGLQESPVEASIPFAVESENPTEVGPDLNVAQVQVPQDSGTNEIESTSQEYDGQGSSDSNIKNSSPQGEGKSNESQESSSNSNIRASSTSSE